MKQELVMASHSRSEACASEIPLLPGSQYTVYVIDSAGKRHNIMRDMKASGLQRIGVEVVLPQKEGEKAHA